MSRDFLNRANEFVGIDQRLWVITETGGFGSAATGGLIPTSTNALEHVSAKIDFNIPREDAAHRSGRSRVTRLSGKKEVKVSYEGYIIPGTPSGSNPTLPDIHPFLLSAFGACNETVATEKLYSFTRASTSSFRLLEEGTHFSRLAMGCVADSLTFTLPGDGKAMFKMEGFGQDAVSSGQSLAAALGTSVNAVTVTTGDGVKFEEGSYIDIILASDGSTRTAASRLISDVTGDVITFGGAPVTFAAGAIIVGAAPDFSADSAQNALLGLKGTFTSGAFGALDCDLLSAEISIKNNYTPKNFVYGTDKICGFVADKRRDVSIKIDILLTKDNYAFYQANKNFTADNLVITLAPQEIPAPINAAAGRTFTFTFPKVEFSIPQIEQPGDSYVKLSLEGVAFSTDVNTPNAEMTLKIS